MDSRALVLIAVWGLAIASSGCLGLGEGKEQGQGPPGDPETRSETFSQTSNGGGQESTPPAGAAMRAEMIDCTDLTIGVTADQAAVAKQLPDGYEPTGLVPGTADINLEIYSCKSVVIGNQTVLSDVAVALTMAFVQPPSAIQAEGPDLYILELATSDATFASFLASHNLTTPLGTISVSTTSPGIATATVEVHGNRSYSANAQPYDGDSFGDTSSRKLHYMTAKGAAWVYSNTTSHRLGEYFRAGNLAVEGGVLSNIGTGSGGQHVIIAQSVTFGTIYEFGRSGAQSE